MKGKPTRPWVSIILLCVTAMPAATQENPAEATLSARVARIIGSQKTVPGLTIFVVARAGEPSFGATAGCADPEGRILTVDTPVRIASNTKTYTAAIHLRLSEAGES